MPSVLGNLEGVQWLSGKLLYGGGLRVTGWRRVIRDFLFPLRK